MYRRQSLKRYTFVFCIALFVGGCGGTQRMYSGESLSRDEVARIRTKFSEKSGHVTRRVTIESVDGEKIDSERHNWVTVPPGRHGIDVSFYKRIDPPGLNIPVKLSIFGVEKDLIEAEPSEIITSTVDESLVANVEAGLSYHIEASDNIREAEPLSPSFLAGMGLSFSRRLVGSWTPRVVAER